MSDPAPLDADWLARHPLPACDEHGDKESRGRILVVGGAELVPGALRLTGEAALRAGAGKLRMATVEAAAIILGVHVPEAAIMALPGDPSGEIAAKAIRPLVEAAARSDAIVLGPGMSDADHAGRLVEALFLDPPETLGIVLDAAAINGAAEHADRIAGHAGALILTPHHGEMARLLDTDRESVAANPLAHARLAARRFGAVVALKAARTLIVAPDGTAICYAGGGPGLATSGSGDVLAGIIGGLLARGADPFVAAATGVWLHGEAGRACAARIGAIGFLARELLVEVPRLMENLERCG